MTSTPTLRCVTCGHTTHTWAQMDRHLVQEHGGHGDVKNILTPKADT